MKLFKTLLIFTMVCGVMALTPATHAGILGETVMVFELSGAQESDPVDTDATGVAVAVLNAAQTSLTVMVSHDVANASAAHIHGPAEAGEDADVLFNLGSATSPIVATWDNITPAQIIELLAGEYYVNVHSPDHPAGEIRGQIVDEGNDITYNFPLSGTQETNPVFEGTSGLGVGTLNGNRTEFAVDITHDVDDATAAHIHGPAMPGFDADVIVNLGDPASPISAVWDDITPAEVFDLVSGLYYVNVHSPDFPAGEIRGQITNTPPPFKPIPGCHAGDTTAAAGLSGRAGDLLLVTLLLGSVALTASRSRKRPTA